MKKNFTIVFVSLIITLFAQNKNQNSFTPVYKYPGNLKFRSFQIGEKVDTSEFKKRGNLYFPNYLDGWTTQNYSQLPDEYNGLPIAIWQSKHDSTINLTLLNNIILKITVSYMTNDEKQKVSKMLTKKFGTDGKITAYEELNPLQEYVTYWNLKTWETKDVIVQIGNYDMKKSTDTRTTDAKWSLVYTDLLLESKIINDYKKK